MQVEYWESVDSDPGNAAPHAGVRTQEYDLTDVRVVVQDRLEGFTALAWSDDVAAQTEVRAGPDAETAPDARAWTTDPDMRVFRLGGPLEVTAPVAAESIVGTVFGHPVPFAFTVPAGDFHLQAAEATHTLTGPLEGYVSGADLTITHGEGTLRMTLEESIEEREGSVYVPEQGWMGPGTHKERVVRYVQLDGQDAALSVWSLDAPTALFAESFHFDLLGHLQVTDADGSLAVEAQDFQEVEGDALVVSGLVKAHVVPTEEQGRARVLATGDVQYVAVGAAAETFAFGNAAKAALGAVALAGLLVAAWQVWASGMGVALFSRVAKKDVLDHDTRSDIYERVKAEPGISPHDLVRATGVGWSTVMYHLTVLERNEIIIAMKDGRYRRYFDRESGRFANGRKAIVAALKNDTTRKIAEHIKDHPGLAQRRLAEHFGLAASSIHWHVKRLVEAGLVEKTRAAQAVALTPGPAWDKIADEDLLATGATTSAGSLSAPSADGVENTSPGA